MRGALAPALLAFALTLGYGALVQPSWEPQFTDQVQYLSLATGLAERGEFTRAAGAESFFPETYRLPGYPLLLAPLCLGGCDRSRIVLAQAFLFAALVFALYGLARRAVPRYATATTLAVAVFLPYAYYGALALSDLPGAVMFGLGTVAWVRALDSRSSRLAVAAGALFGLAGLIRGVLTFAPLVLALVAAARDRRAARVAITACVAAALVLAPYVAYSASTFARPTGGTSGLVLWLGVFQGRDEGSLDTVERTEADAARADIASFDAIADRTARALAWPVLDDALGARARTLIAHDVPGWLARGVVRSVVLWAGDTPVPGGATGAGAAALVAAQAVLLVLAIGGATVLARRGDHVSLVIAAVFAYVWLTALPFQTEARYALPGRAAEIIAAFAFVDSRRRTHATATSKR